MVRRNLLNDYLNEPVIIGGEETTRGQFIIEMQNDGASRNLIDAYLMGFDLQKDLARNDRKRVYCEK
jgi:hypothetical protein